MRLHLSSSCSTGYKGVWRQSSGRFQARLDGRLVSIGSFGTAVEAAVAYARAVGEYQPPAVAKEADGLRLHLFSSSSTGYKGTAGTGRTMRLRLHLSSNSSTGYKGVQKHSGRFQARQNVDGKDVSLGTSPAARDCTSAARNMAAAQPKAPPRDKPASWASGDHIDRRSARSDRHARCWAQLWRDGRELSPTTAE